MTQVAPRGTLKTPDAQGGYLVTRIEVTNEATIACTPEEYWAAIDDEYSGRSQWWLPYVKISRRGADADGLVGSVFDVAVNVRGRVERRLGTIRFAQQVTAFDVPHRASADYVEGPLRGSSETRVEALGPDRTKVTIHFQARPHGMAGTVLGLLGFERPHHQLTETQFPAVEAYVRSMRAPG